MQISILTQYYPPETGAPQNRLSDLARRFRTMGHQVTVLTALPNYPQGRFFAGFRNKLLARSNQDGVQVIHCWLFPTRSQRVTLRLLNYFTFVFSSAFFGSWLLPKADLLIVESPPLFLGLSAWWLSRLKGAAMAMNVSDLYPETAISLGYLRNSWLRKIMYRLEAWCYGKARFITGQTEGIMKSIQDRFPDKPTFLLTNGVDLEKFGAERLHIQSNGTKPRSFLVGYAGILGYAQRLDTVIEAANLLKNEPGIQFAIFGDGPLREVLQHQARAMGLANVAFMGHRTRDEVLEALGHWDAGLVPLMNAPLMAGALPSKMFEIMASGKPVILSAPEGEASTLVARAGAGIWVPPEDPQALANAIQDLTLTAGRARQLGDNGREFVARYYDRSQIAYQFDIFLNDFLDRT